MFQKKTKKRKKSYKKSKQQKIDNMRCPKAKNPPSSSKRGKTKNNEPLTAVQKTGDTGKNPRGENTVFPKKN